MFSYHRITTAVHHWDPHLQKTLPIVTYNFLKLPYLITRLSVFIMFNYVLQCLTETTIAQLVSFIVFSANNREKIHKYKFQKKAFIYNIGEFTSKYIHVV